MEVLGTLALAAIIKGSLELLIMLLAIPCLWHVARYAKAARLRLRETLICQRCGREIVAPGAKFCGRCGGGLLRAA